MHELHITYCAQFTNRSFKKNIPTPREANIDDHMKKWIEKEYDGIGKMR